MYSPGSISLAIIHTVDTPVYVKQYPTVAISFQLISCILASHAVVSLWMNMEQDVLPLLYCMKYCKDLWFLFKGL